MDVSNVCASRHFCIACDRLSHCFEVQRSASHIGTPVGGVAPLFTWEIPVDLDPIPLGVSEIQRLGNAVVSCTAELPVVPDPGQCIPQRLARGDSERIVIEARTGTVPGKGSFVAFQDEQRCVPRIEDRFGVGTAEHCETDDLPVERGKLVEIVNAERGSSQPCCCREDIWPVSSGVVPYSVDGEECKRGEP